MSKSEEEALILLDQDKAEACRCFDHVLIELHVIQCFRATRVNCLALLTTVIYLELLEYPALQFIAVLKTGLGPRRRWTVRQHCNGSAPA